MRPLVSMRDALADPEIFGSVMPGDSWLGWRSLLIAIVGEALTAEERVAFTMLTGRDLEPLEMVEEFWAVVGRRGGKTRAAAVLAVYFGALVDYDDVLAVGERGTIPLMAATQKQAQAAFGYIVGIMRSVPLLSGMIQNETADMLSLSNRIDIEIRPANYRSARSATCVAAIGDEAAFWRSDESANPDTEILNAIRPSLATTGGPLIVISSPYARKGELYSTWKRDFGAGGDPLVLVAQAASRVLNPKLSQRVVDRAMNRDPASAKAEYLAQFRMDVEACLTIEAVEAVTPIGVFEKGRITGYRYYGFIDPSGGSADSMTLAIAHKEGDRAVLDLVREVIPPFSPEVVVKGFVEDLRKYGIAHITGDRFAGEWAREPFRKAGIEYQANAKAKSDLYRDLIPRVNSREVELLDVPRLSTQLVGLERRTSRGGRDSIDHSPGAHDDVANAVAGALIQVFDKHFHTAKPGSTTTGTMHLGYGPAPRLTGSSKVIGGGTGPGQLPPAPPMSVALPPAGTARPPMPSLRRTPYL